MGEALSRLMLLGITADQRTDPSALAIFGLGCACAAEAVVLLDVCVFVVKRWSFLGYRHHWIRTIPALILIPAAAGIVGMFGFALDVLQGSRPACIAVGIAWPSLLTVLFGIQDKGQTDEDPEAGRELV